MRAKLVVTLGLVLILSACSKKEPASGTTAADTLGATADTPASADADLRSVQDYKLSMDRIDQFYASMRNVALALKDMTPEERQQHDVELGEGDASLDEMAERLDQEPVMRKALADAGLSAREYAVLTMAILQSGMAAAILEMRPEADADSLIRAMQANPENVRFMQEHKDELEAKQKAMQEEMERLGIPE
ncbi:MAG TPA: hypothetical protein VFG50_15700 [Rhodothermales bacterium]|nr:hypothetical protein [Rhodothermales bacterium]